MFGKHQRMKKSNPPRPSVSFLKKRRASSLSRTGPRIGLLQSKKANVKRLTANSVILVRSADQEEYAFSISKVKGYAGQDPSEFGLIIDADVLLDIEKGEVKEAELLG